MGYIVGLIGVAVFMDGWFSIMLYLGKPSYRGTAQSWRLDHSIRLARCAYGLALVAIGWLQL